MGVVNPLSNTVTVSGVGLYDPIWTLVAASNPLPVSLVLFTAEINKSGVTELNWVTSSEINSDFFTIEKSKDGVSFSDLLKVPGSGNSTTTHYYHAADTTPYLGYTYYRIKQTDYNGNFTYSEIRAVRKSAMPSETISVFPNPATDVIFIEENSDENVVAISIFDIHGKLIRMISGDALKPVAPGLIQIDRSTLTAGIYFITDGVGSPQKLILL